ncbi:MAG TPA: methylenetetrahydrofolate reductase [Vicinamibacteria bacterium]
MNLSFGPLPDGRDAANAQQKGIRSLDPVPDLDVREPGREPLLVQPARLRDEAGRIVEAEQLLYAIGKLGRRPGRDQHSAQDTEPLRRRDRIYWPGCASATVPHVNLHRGIAARSGGFLLFAVTPPRLTTRPPEAAEIGRVTLERLRPLAIDGLVLYDIDDESDRNPDERPFPFLPTMDPADYLDRDLAGLDVPAIVYRAVGKYREDRFRSWLEQQDPSQALTVFVGSSSREKAVLTSLARAYELREQVQPELLLGGVAIAERHARLGDEHLRLIAKQIAGCSFFVTQIVYDVNAAKNLISDYHHECDAQNLEPVPIVFSFSVCGSLKTLEFLQWLGVTVPRWIENELRHADDTLDASYEQAVTTAVDLIAFCRRLGVPFGLNVESVSIRKAEIEASVRLATQLGAELRN